MISLYKNKNDIQNCNNYSSISLLKPCKFGESGGDDDEEVENQFGFMLGHSTI